MKLSSQPPIFRRAILPACCVLLLAACGGDSKEEARSDDPVPENKEPPQATVQSENQRKAAEQRIDPRNGPWRSEVFAEEAGAQLKKLAKILQSGEGIDEAGLSELAARDVKTGMLRPAQLETIFEAEGITVRRGGAGSEGPGAGIAHGLTRLRALVDPLGPTTLRRVSLKIGRVDLAEDGGETSVSYDAAGAGVQQTAQWRCEWKSGSDGVLRLASFSLRSYEEVSWEGRPWFTDLTAPAFGDGTALPEYLAFGLNHWLGRIDRAYGINYFRRTGLAVGDANGDGRDDLYLCQSGGLPNRLMLAQSDGTAREAGAQFGVDWLDHTSSALFLDLDNDGDQDLVLAAGARVQVLENVENRSFRPRAALALLDHDSLSLSSADHDGDGDLDLYVCVGFATKSAHARQGRELPGFVFHDSRDGGRNVLFRNEGGWKFSDATKETGLEAGNFRHSLAASWEDYDRDGDPDLYIANDYGPNSFYRNEGGRFEEVAGELGVSDYAAGMSVSWGDYDRDGLMDLYVGNMYSYAGQRITNQADFLPGADDEFRAVNRRFAKGNSLFRNSAEGAFTETSAEAGVERGRWAWGSLFADFNNDGWEDLFVSNGYITTADPGDL